LRHEDFWKDYNTHC